MYPYGADAGHASHPRPRVRKQSLDAGRRGHPGSAHRTADRAHVRNLPTRSDRTLRTRGVRGAARPAIRRMPRTCRPWREHASSHPRWAGRNNASMWAAPVSRSVHARSKESATRAPVGTFAASCARDAASPEPTRHAARSSMAGLCPTTIAQRIVPSRACSRAGRVSASARYSSCL
jgi:hypothetical protein